ncbi:TPA: hemerythrin domain-containing protein [Legionella feeleii]|uniref:Hemerythrin-like domain-containing protein n=1 Tax=Legionella feeleii TaxID=453 RepID=A0A378IX08_9GAMM|nr:hemerythrin domain-containing protein [Legionella feeleii]STX39021.1 Uncharacterised protein [Legionella feeleii]
MRIDFYTHVHQCQRKQMFNLAMYAGEINYNEPEKLLPLAEGLTVFLRDIRSHADHEDIFIHPLLRRKMPGSARTLDNEHEELKKELSNLEENFAHIQLLTNQYPKRQEQGLEFYRALNRFIANYLCHIDKEEYVIQNLWEIAAAPELGGMMMAFQVYNNPEEGRKWLSNNLPGMNFDERVLMFKTVELMAPESCFLSMSKIAEEIVGDNAWQSVKQHCDKVIA